MDSFIQLPANPAVFSMAAHDDRPLRCVKRWGARFSDQ